MLTHRSILGRLLLSLAVCFLLCGIASAEFPELLTLIDNTSNDFTISKGARQQCTLTPTLSEGRSNSAPLDTQNFECGAHPHCSPTVVGAETISSDLFVLYSNFRR
jgi:hypothetical protein